MDLIFLPVKRGNLSFHGLGHHCPYYLETTKLLNDMMGFDWDFQQQYANRPARSLKIVAQLSLGEHQNGWNLFMFIQKYDTLW